MTQKRLKLFFKYLKRDNLLAGPVREGSVLNFKEVDSDGEIELTNEIPLHSFKKFLLPDREVLKDGCKKSPLIPLYKKRNIMNMALIGLTAPDLKAITILNHIFEKDPFYQNRIKNTLIVGFAKVPDEYKAMFAARYEENILEHAQFDIFIVMEKSSNSDGAGKNKRRRTTDYKIFSGSEEGQRVLDNFGYSQYENIQFTGLIPEEGRDKNTEKVREAMGELSPMSKVFEDLGKRCVECGRCSIICPLCFCFCLKDNCSQKIEDDTSNSRLRITTTCFYSKFSEVAGGHKFLKTSAERIFNWYEHKFIRMPDELSVPGCVSCGRCARVCPAGINIREVVNKIINNEL